jgi:hypothetical protein
MTAAEAKAEYEKHLRNAKLCEANRKESRRLATEYSNLYGRLCREELRAAQSKPAAGGKA